MDYISIKDTKRCNAREVIYKNKLFIQMVQLVAAMQIHTMQLYPLGMNFYQSTSAYLRLFFGVGIAQFSENRSPTTTVEFFSDSSILRWIL